jgi:hypothetical protein
MSLIGPDCENCSKRCCPYNKISWPKLPYPDGEGTPCPNCGALMYFNVCFTCALKQLED